MDILEDNLFPFQRIRDEQRGMFNDVLGTVKGGETLLAHAPTGIGKTAASLAPALSYALDNGKSLLFLTPKHSQHRLAVDTLKRVRDRYGRKMTVVDIIGKQWTCLYEDAGALTSTEFSQFCQSHKRNETCGFYNNVHNPASREVSKEAKAAVKRIKGDSPMHSEEIVEICKRDSLCPYEVTTMVARSADTIICDYYHIFHPSVRQAFLGRMDKGLDDIILVVDEAHNLPERIRRLMSSTLSEYTINSAIKEALALREENLEDDLGALLGIMKKFGKKLKGDEMFVGREEFVGEVEDAISMGIEPFIEDLEGFGEAVLELPNRYRSYCSGIAGFLTEWTNGENEEAYARIFSTYQSQTGRRYQLAIRCLDPAIYSEGIFAGAHASVLMSGTLLPLEMYETVLGIHNARKEQYSNPFPAENRLVILTHGITTKYTHRTEHMWNKIAGTLSGIASSVPGNVAAFFSSYGILDTISKRLDAGPKEVIVERRGMGKSQRYALYKRLEDTSDKGGGFLLAVQAGSFSEGMDFPGRMLDCVVVVGLPLEKPTLETEALINYYDLKFGRGWDYGYIYPAMNRALQAAGRCIRSESDRGAVILMDDRFNWKNYRKAFPKDMSFIVTEKPQMYLEKFFNV